MAKTLLSPFLPPLSPSAPAIILPASSPTPNVTLSYAQFAAEIDGLRRALDVSGGLAIGDVVSMSFVNGVEFAFSFLAVAAHR